MTIAQYDQLREAISDKIERDGYVPPTRTLADEFHCSPVTVWRIVRSLGWQARGHHWTEERQNENERVIG